MGPRCLFVARHIIGFLEPTWILLSALATGLAAGFAVTGSRTIIAGLPATILCIVASYITTLILFGIIDRILGVRGGATILGAVVFALTSAACFAGPLLVASDNRNWLRAVDRALVFTPAGYAASVLAGENAVPCTFALIVWCIGLAIVLAKLEQRKSLRPAAASSVIIGECLYDRVESLFGEQSGPLVGKALRYHLRSNRARFNLAMSVPMMVFLPRLMSRNSGSETTFVLTLAVFFCGGVLAANTTTFNLFGYDGAGIRRYYLVPVPLVRALQAGSIASLLVGGTAILPGLVLWMLTAGPDFYIRKALMLFSSGIAGLLVFNALGMWTTVMEPRNLDFGSVVGNQLSSSGNLAMFGGLSLALGAAFILNGNGCCGMVLEHWWLLPCSAVFCVGIYSVSLRLVEGLLERRRESLVEILAGQSSN